MSPHLPVTAKEIADQAIGAAEAGAAILHLHARDPDTGQPSASPEHFMAFLPEINARCDAVLNLSTGGSAVMTLDAAAGRAAQGRAGDVLAQHGHDEFRALSDGARYDTWLHDWEQPFLEGTPTISSSRTPRATSHASSTIWEPSAAPASSSSAMTSATCTCCGISPTAGW
jgi:uncharacterized protein (DUF849 family)